MDKVGITPFKFRLLRFNNGSFSNDFERLWILIGAKTIMYYTENVFQGMAPC